MFAYTIIYIYIDGTMKQLVRKEGKLFYVNYYIYFFAKKEIKFMDA